MKNSSEVTISKELVDICSKMLGVSEDLVTATSDIYHDLGADSVVVVELVMEIEEHFDLIIPDQDWETLRTVGALQDYLQEKGVLKK